MTDTLLTWALDLANWVVERLPDADTGPLTDFVEPIGRLVCWMLLLNESLPVVEGLLGLTLMGSVWVALYGVMLVRRLFSLLWPGAGS